MDAEKTLMVHGAERGGMDRMMMGLADDLKGVADECTDSLHLSLPNSTLEWGRHFLPAYFAKPASALHRWLGETLDSIYLERGSKINLIGPRGSAKSTIATLCYVLRAALEGRERYIWIVSDTLDQAQIHLENIKAEILGNTHIKQTYSKAAAPGAYWRATSIELANGVAIDSFGTGQSIRGRRRSEDRPALIVCDDLQNDSHISSPGQRDASRQWFRGTLLNAGTTNTNIINLATALHREALAIELLRAPGWTSRSFPALITPPKNTALWEEWDLIYSNVDNPEARQLAREFYEARRAVMDAGAVVLWPEVEDLYTLMRMRVEIGQTAFDREKQGSPHNAELSEWPDSYFGDDIWFDEWPTDLKVRTIALDPSKGADSRCGDYSAFVLAGIDRRNVMYVEADLARRPTPRMVAEGVALWKRFSPDQFGVEANQYQELLCNEFANEFAEQGVGHVVPVELRNLANKQVRIRRLGPQLSKRRLKFLANSPSTQLLVDQLRDFPNGAHDDGPDALEMALRLATEILNQRCERDGLGDRLIFN